MKHALVLSALSALTLLCMPGGVQAQGFDSSLTSPRALGPVLPVPECFEIINRAPYTVTGGIFTNYYIGDDGIKARHNEGFRLKSGERMKACTSGPFYEGMKIDFVIRSFVPLFSCRTTLSGPIEIFGETLKEGGTKTWATCRE